MTTTTEPKKVRPAFLWEALIPVVMLIVMIRESLVRYEGAAHIPLLLAAAIAALAADRDVTLVEGSGGVAVRLDTDGRTLLSLTGHLVETCHDVRLVVVTSLALGTLNHTELTVAAILSAGLAPAALVVGSLPAELGLAERCNIEELPRVTGVSLRGCVPAGVGGWEPDRFRQGALGWLDSPALLDG